MATGVYARWLFCALCALLAGGNRGCSGSSDSACSGGYLCPSICDCTRESLRCDNNTEIQGSSRPFTPQRLLKLNRLTLNEIPTHAFVEMNYVHTISITGSRCITRIRTQAFLSLHSLKEITIYSMKSLKVIENKAFTDLPNLEYLSIYNTGLIHFPDFSTISSLVPSIFLEMIQNPMVESIPANVFAGTSKNTIEMNLLQNGFKEIHAHAFNGSKMDRLTLAQNWNLKFFHEDALEGATGPTTLDVSSTSLTSLPSRGLGMVRHLKALFTPTLKSLPPPGSLAELRAAELTYASHCCAFHKWFLKESEDTSACDAINLDVLSSDYFSQDYPELVSKCIDKNPSIQCIPEPNAFNPCEDLLGFPFLRYLIWIITLFAVLGNMTILVVMLFGYDKMSISRFLMCNLAFADLCMGLYLMLIAIMDQYSRHEYYNYAMNWQSGPGCATAGFLTVFASHLSVYTLTVISVERWSTISYPLHINKHLSMRRMAAIMAAGWAFSVLLAMLPLVGVSSYSKASICLPMDIDKTVSQVYIVAMLIFNVVVFVVVCLCYIGIYLSVYRSEPSPLSGETRMAKRMAVLIFTNFMCMAPISFFAISAALHMPLITMSQSKILLVIFYPINSLCNPFLYTIITQAFRKEVCQLLRRCASRRHRQSDTQMFELTKMPYPIQLPQQDIELLSEQPRDLVCTDM